MEMNIKEASRFIKVARSTLYNKITSGELSKTPSGKLDSSELFRVFGHPNERDKTRRKLEFDQLKNSINTVDY